MFDPLGSESWRQPEFVADKTGATANVRLPSEEAREVPSLDLSSR